MGDGVLTPAQSVLGAIYGLQVKTNVHQSELPCIAFACNRPHTHCCSAAPWLLTMPDIRTWLLADTVVGVSIAIIVLLFAAQRFGTNRLGAYFSPIVLIYFLLNIIIACTNIHR